MKKIILDKVSLGVAVFAALNVPTELDNNPLYTDGQFSYFNNVILEDNKWNKN